MADQLDIRTFEGGMDTDSSIAALAKNKYRYAQNFRLISEDGDNNYIFENTEGNAVSLPLNETFGTLYKLVGNVFIKPYLVLFLTTNTTTLIPDGATSDKRSAIAKVTIDGDIVQNIETIYIDGGTKGYLDLSVNYPIKATGYYETSDIIKVYWTDSYNEMRWMNIQDSNLSSQNVSAFSFIPKFPDVSSTADIRLELDSVIDGSLQASSVQYTYQYYKTNGAATRFAPLSPPIPVPKNNGTYSGFRGGELEEETSIGLRLKLNTASTKVYDRIRLVALDFFTYSATPVVRVFGEYKLSTDDTSTALYFNDIGDTINELVYEEFLTTGDTVYKAKDIAVKDSMLFAANIEEDSFDAEFDARAYRHNSDGVAYLYESDLTTNITTDSAGISTDYTWADVPEEHDCINIYNDPDNEQAAGNQYLYQGDGSTLGAEGVNVKIDVVLNDDIVLDISPKNSTTALAWIEPGSENAGHPLNAAYKRSFQRMEVYRLGIILFNNKLQASSVKWSCDFKMPHWAFSRYEYGTSSMYEHVSTTGDNVYAKSLGLDITLKNALPDGVVAWQAVMVPRRQEDKSILFNALLQSTRRIDTGSVVNLYPITDNTPTATAGQHSLTTVANIYDGASDERKYMHLLMSPDINYYGDLLYQGGDFLHTIGKFGYADSGSTTNSYTDSTNHVTNHKLYDLASDFADDPGNTIDVVDFKIVPQTANTSDKTYVGDYRYSNYAGDISDVTGALHGTLGVAVCGSGFPADGSITDTDKILMVSYRRNNFSSQYGGVDHYSRTRNEYVGFGPVSTTPTSINSTYEGDTYIDFFWYLKTSKDLTRTDQDTTYLTTLLFPAESTICPSLDYTRVDRQSSGGGANLLMTESQGVYSNDTFTFDQDFSLYQYNFSYSITGLGKYYYDELLDQSDETVFPNRIRNSEIKQPGEIEDSFTIFKANNYKEVSGVHGPINNIKTFKNNLFFWQDSAFGIASVNYRSLIQDSSASTLALGTGGVLDRIDYVSETVGNMNDHGIIASHKFLYWVDNMNSEVYKYSGSEQPLSKIKGIQSWIKENGKIGWVIGTYDPKYNQVLFTMSFARKFEDATVINTDDIRAFDSATDETGLAKDATIYKVILNSVYDDQRAYSKNNTIQYFTGNSWWALGRYIKGDANTDAYFTIKNDPTKTHTLVFSEKDDVFTGFETMAPDMYLRCDSFFMTTKDLLTLYGHYTEDAKKGLYYGQYYPSIVTTVFNKDYPLTKVYDNVRWLSESIDGEGINQFKDTFDYVEFWNDYQHTGDRDLYYQHDTAPATRPTPISRRERTWSMQMPRNIVDLDVADNPDVFDETNWDSTRQFKERIRDKYLTAKFTYTNAEGVDNRTFSVPFVSTTYRKSFR